MVLRAAGLSGRVRVKLVQYRLHRVRLCGDVDFEQVKEVAGHITPVPGGVGPMTITMLLVNTVEAAEQACTDHLNSQIA